MACVLEGTNAETVSAKAMPGKYLTFQLNGELYGAEILRVQEIIGTLPVTQIPKAPAFVRGVINLRGRIIPVVDLRRRFDMDTQEDTERTCIVVMQVGSDGKQITQGLLVDEVSEVLEIRQEQLEMPPQLGRREDSEYVLGMGKVGQKVIMLLDMDRVFSTRTEEQDVDEGTPTL